MFFLDHYLGRLFPITDIFLLRTPRVKGAAGRKVQEAGDNAFDFVKGLALSPPALPGQGNGPQQAPGVGMAGLLKNLLRDAHNSRIAPKIV